MFERLLALFEGDASYTTPMPDADPSHAFGALLVRVAKSDDNYQVAELQKIDMILADYLRVNAVDAAKFRAECELLEQAMPETAALSGILTGALSPPEREAMFLALWDVLRADGVERVEEVDVLTQVRNIFAIPPERAAELIT